MSVFDRLAVLSGAFVVLSLGAVRAVEPKDASYFCVVEAAGGISFNAAQQRWVGTVFRPTEKFVLRLRYIDSNTVKTPPYPDELYTNFEAFITEGGTNKERQCLGFDKKTISVDRFNSLRCRAMLQDYRFDVGTNRFLQTYAVGYTDGTDGNSDTPSIAGGTCTKIK